MVPNMRNLKHLELSMRISQNYLKLTVKYVILGTDNNVMFLVYLNYDNLGYKL